MSDNFVPIQLHPPGIYHEYPVSPNLQEYISVYWIHSHDMDTVFEAIPDGCVDLILANTLNTCFVVPTPTKRETYKIPANTPLFGIRFLPIMFERFFSEIRFSKGETIRELDIDSHPLLGELYEITVSATTVDKQCIDEIERCLVSAILIPIRSYTHLSPRQKQRKTIQATGVTPKSLEKILRLQESIIMMRKNRGTKTPGIYYDQSHMIREFRALTGETPSEFMKKIA